MINCFSDLVIEVYHFISNKLINFCETYWGKEHLSCGSFVLFSRLIWYIKIMKRCYRASCRLLRDCRPLNGTQNGTSYHHFHFPYLLIPIKSKNAVTDPQTNKSKSKPIKSYQIRKLPTIPAITVKF